LAKPSGTSNPTTRLFWIPSIMTSRRDLLCSSALSLATLAIPAHALPQTKAEVEHRSTLTRVREGGTPYDPKQSLVPYAIDLTAGGDGGVADSPAGALIASPPEYGPTHGVLFQYGTTWNWCRA
jgi:hypothetical protein